MNQNPINKAVELVFTLLVDKTMCCKTYARKIY